MKFKNAVKDYFRRTLEPVHKWELVYWWILRALMIFALIYTIVVGHGPMGDYKGSNPWQQVAANLVGMFAYEIIQFFPKKNRLRLLSPRFQNITALGFFLGSFGGAFMNLYYLLPMYDKILHAFGTAEAVYIGYEYVCATQLKLKKTCPHQIANVAALGFGFILSSGWELFEFTYDQFFGGDAQHWNYALALESAGGDASKIFNFIPLTADMLAKGRFSLMDTMGDIILNFIGAFIMFAVLYFFPYRHRGKNDINALIEAENKQS